MVPSSARPGRATLLRTAIELMAENGYEGTSTRDIAAAAGVSVAALYYHFPSKQEMLRQFLDESHEVVLGRLVRAIAAAGSAPRARLDAVVETLIWSNLHDQWARKAARVAWREQSRLADTDRRLIVKKIGAMVELIEEVIEEGVHAAVFRAGDPHGVARAVLTLCIGVIDPFPAVDRSVRRVIAQHQRFAAALAEQVRP